MMEIWQFDLRRGNSDDPRNGACLLDAVSWFQYGRLGDHPPCVSPVYASVGRIVNDMLPDDRRQELKPLVFRLPGTVDPAAERDRAEFIMWRAIRVFAPLALEAAALDGLAHAIELRDHADRLRNQRVVETAEAAARAARAAADTARAAAWAARVADAATIVAWTTVDAADAAAWAADAAAWATVEAASAAASAARAARAASAAASAARAASAAHAPALEDRVYDSTIAAFEGVLKIGKQAPPIGADAIERANRTFALARV